MRKVIYVGMLSFLMFCNNTDKTVVNQGRDGTDVDDTVSPHAIDSLHRAHVNIDSTSLNTQ